MTSILGSEMKASVSGTKVRIPRQYKKLYLNSVDRCGRDPLISDGRFKGVKKQISSGKQEKRLKNSSNANCKMQQKNQVVCN